MKLKRIDVSSAWFNASIYMNFFCFVLNFSLGMGNIFKSEPKLFVGIFSSSLSLINLYFSIKFLKHKIFTFDYTTLPSRIGYYNKHFEETIDNKNEIYTYKKLKDFILNFFKENKEYNLIFNNCSEFTLESASRNTIFSVHDYTIKIDKNFILVRNYKDLFKFYRFCEKKLENL